RIVGYGDERAAHPLRTNAHRFEHLRGGRARGDEQEDGAAQNLLNRHDVTTSRLFIGLSRSRRSGGACPAEAEWRRRRTRWNRTQPAAVGATTPIASLVSNSA